jgi:hypothetical protein
MVCLCLVYVRRRGVVVLLQDAFDLAARYRNVSDVLFVRTPSFASLCPSDEACSGPRGYKPIVISNPPVMQRLPKLITGGTVACPPHCPGVEESRVGTSGVYYTPTCAGTAPEPK